MLAPKCPPNSQPLPPKFGGSVGGHFQFSGCVGGHFQYTHSIFYKGQCEFLISMSLKISPNFDIICPLICPLIVTHLTIIFKQLTIQNI